MIDGSSSGPTAATLEPYTSNPNDCGIMTMEQDQIDDYVMRAHKAGYRVTSHAVGDKAVTAIVEALEKALAAHPTENRRHRIEHCAIINSDLLARIKKLGVVPVPQPAFLYEFGDGYMRNYGEKRVSNMFACKSYFDNDVICAGSSDCPVTFSNPLHGMHLAVNRVTQSGQAISQNQRITIEQALRMFTYNGAYAVFQEDRKGSIEVGKVADLAVLSESLLDCASEKIRDIIVELTMIDGKIVYTN
jgi:predicted amidohydrolase YtcJ